MSDDNDSGGIIGAIISILILAALWPYLLALLGIYIAYILAVAVLEWIASNWQMVVMIVSSILGTYALIHYKVVQRIWRKIILLFQQKPVEITLEQGPNKAPDLSSRPFNPTSNLYCYWCTKKLGVQAYKFHDKYYCLECRKKNKTLDI
jgi:hypothetical protein